MPSLGISNQTLMIVFSVFIVAFFLGTVVGALIIGKAAQKKEAGAERDDVGLKDKEMSDMELGAAEDKTPPIFQSPSKTDGEEFQTPPSRVSRKERGAMFYDASENANELVKYDHDE